MIGILGGGQLARMMILAGIPLGLRFRVFSSQSDAPTEGLVETVIGPYDDRALQEQFANGLSAITYEFENLPLAAVSSLSELAPVYPPPVALAVGQNRAEEKSLFQRLGVPTTTFRIVERLPELRAALAEIGLPAVIKTIRLGYDGKGQCVVRSREVKETILAELGEGPYLVENFIDFERELSIVGVRSSSGEIRTYPLGENLHEGGILRRTIAPAHVDERIEALAIEYITRIMQELDYRGVLAIEFFHQGGKLIANEIAPRVHNTGHWTIEGAETSQFENHIRAVIGLPLGSTAAVGGSVMVNLIGEIPPSDEVLKHSGAHLHLYGKQPRPNRKLGHITFHAETLERAISQAQNFNRG